MPFPFDHKINVFQFVWSNVFIPWHHAATCHLPSRPNVSRNTATNAWSLMSLTGKWNPLPSSFFPFVSIVIYKYKSISKPLKLQPWSVHGYIPVADGLQLLHASFAHRPAHHDAVRCIAEHRVIQRTYHRLLPELQPPATAQRCHQQRVQAGSRAKSTARRNGIRAGCFAKRRLVVH